MADNNLLGKEKTSFFNKNSQAGRRRFDPGRPLHNFPLPVCEKLLTFAAMVKLAKPAIGIP